MARENRQAVPLLLPSPPYAPSPRREHHVDGCRREWGRLPIGPTQKQASPAPGTDRSAGGRTAATHRTDLDAVHVGGQLHLPR